jgi:hypothetical protein
MRKSWSLAHALFFSLGCATSTAFAQPLASGSFAQIASGAGLTSTITLVNTSSAQVQVHLKFFADDGSPLLLPLTLPQLGNSLDADSLDQTLPGNANLVVDVAVPVTSPVKAGSARLTSDGPVNGFVLIRTQGNGQEAILPLETRSASSYMVPFKNSSGAVTGIAVANLIAAPTNVSVIVRVGGGFQFDVGMITLPAGGHTSFVLDRQFPLTALLSGTLEFRTSSPGQISVAGLPFSPTGAFTAFPVFSNTFSGTGSIAQVAAGGGVTTTIVFLNTGSSTADLSIQFFGDDGMPLPLDLGIFGFGCSPAVSRATSSVERTIASGAACSVFASSFSKSPLVGSAHIAINGSGIGWIEYLAGPDRDAVVPLENRAASSFVLPYDNTNGTLTGVAIANLTVQTADVATVIRDDTGAQIGSGTIVLVPEGHSSFVLSDQFPVTTNRRGTVEFGTPGVGQISVLGLRFAPSGAVAGIPILAP